MGNKGKHLAKNNPDANGQRLKATVATAILLGSLGVGIKSIVKSNDNRGNNSSNIDTTIEDQSYSVDEFFNIIKAKYNRYQNISWNDLSTQGLILSYFESKISSPELTEDQKLEMLSNLLNDEHLTEDVLEYINDNSFNAIPFQQTEVDMNNIVAIKNDQKIMAFIRDAAEAYQVPEEILVGIIARSMDNGELNANQVESSYSESWRKIGERRSSHNYTTNEDNRLDEWQEQKSTTYPTEVNYVARLAASLANAIKENNGDIVKAISATTSGLNTTDNIKDCNETLSYAMAYLGDGRFVVHYASGRGNKYCTVTFASNNYSKEFLPYTLHLITTDINGYICIFYNENTRS